jgi:hypothetical protein
MDEEGDEGKRTRTKGRRRLFWTGLQDFGINRMDQEDEEVREGESLRGEGTRTRTRTRTKGG